MTLKEAATGLKKEIKVLRRATCATCGGSGAAPGTHPEPCQHCGGRGQVMHSQGFLMISSTCPVCRGEGRIVRKPCAHLRRRAASSTRRTRCRSRSRPASRTARPCACRGAARRPRGAASPGACSSSCASQPDERFERDGADLHTEVAVSFPQLALGDEIERPDSGR